MSRVRFLKRLFAVFVLPVFILAVVSFASAQEGKADVCSPSAPLLPPSSPRTRLVRMSTPSSVRLRTSRRSRIPSR